MNAQEYDAMQIFYIGNLILIHSVDKGRGAWKKVPPFVMLSQPGRGSS